MNLRTLRHVIEMRTDPGAEEELRLIFGQLGEIMVEEAPGCSRTSPGRTTARGA